MFLHSVSAENTIEDEVIILLDLYNFSNNLTVNCWGNHKKIED